MPKTQTYFYILHKLSRRTFWRGRFFQYNAGNIKIWSMCILMQVISLCLQLLCNPKRKHQTNHTFVVYNSEGCTVIIQIDGSATESSAFTSCIGGKHELHCGYSSGVGRLDQTISMCCFYSALLPVSILRH